MARKQVEDTTDRAMDRLLSIATRIIDRAEREHRIPAVAYDEITEVVVTAADRLSSRAPAPEPAPPSADLWDIVSQLKEAE
jgi:hypothetical protein